MHESEGKASQQNNMGDVFLDSVEDARLYTKILLEAAAGEHRKLASPNVTCPRTGKVYSGRVGFVERAYRGDRRVVMQVLHLGRAAIGEANAYQALMKVRDDLLDFYRLAAPASATEGMMEGDCLCLALKDGNLRVSIEMAGGETSLIALS
ncbi:TPA: hypothetical protein ACKRQV_000241 [Pseudomonas aeruginosa]